MSKSNRSKLKSALKTFFAKRQGLSLESQVAILTMLVGAAWADGAQAAEGSEPGLLPVDRLSPAEQKAIAEIKALMQDGLTSEEIAQIIESTQQLEAKQVTDVLEALLSDEALASENIDEMVEQLRAQLEQSRGEVIALSPSAGKTTVAVEHKPIESEFGADAPSAGSSKVSVETPAQEDDDNKGAILLNSGDPTQTLGLAPAFFAAGPLGPVLGGVAAAAALAGGGGGGSSTPALITHNGEAIDGYVVGADVFVKSADGTLTKVGTTDANGQFLGLDGTLGLKLTQAQTTLHLVVSGGTDSSTGAPFQGEMEAPAGALVVTPLTTIVAKMMDQDPALTAEQANDALVAKLGLAPGTDLLTLDPIQVANDPDATPEEAAMALEAYQRALSIISLAQNAAAVGGLSFADAFDSVVNSISTQLVTEIADVGVDGVTSYADSTDFVTVATGGLADLNAEAFTGDNLTAFIDAGKDVVGQIDVTVSIDDADSDRNEAEAGILGTAESELLEGTEINDLIVGFGGDDTLLGGAGDDTLLGGLGNDSLIGGAGVDTIFGSEGDDTVEINLFTESAGLSDSIELGSGIDVVEVKGGVAGDVFNLTFNAAEVGNDDVHNSETGDLAVTLSVAGNETLSTRLDDEGLRFVADGGATFTVNDGETTGSFAEVVLGSAGADTLEATVESGDVYMQGGAGNDLLTGGAGNDVLFGGTGDDDVVGGAGNDALSGGAGNDNLLGGVGNDILSGGAGDDSIDGGAGDDIAELDLSTDGSDSIDLGEGRDTISLTGAQHVRVTLDLSGVGDGSTTNTDNELAVGVQAEDDNGNLTGVESRTEDEFVRLVSEDGAKFDVRDSVTNEFYGDNFDAVYLGSDTSDGINLSDDPEQLAANVFVAGGAGNDSINSGLGDDYISGGAGDDFVIDAGGNNTLVGGDGRDVLAVVNFGQGEEFLGASSLIGGEGNDVLVAFGANNTLEGGAGDDLLLANGLGNNVAVINLADEGEDLISLGAGYNTVNVQGEGQFRINLDPTLVGDSEVAGLSLFGGDQNLPLNVYLGLEDKDGNAPEFTGGAVDLNLSSVVNSGSPAIASTRAEDEGMRFVAVDEGTFDVRERSGSNPNESVAIGDTFKVVSLGTIAGEVLDESETAGDVYVNAGFGDDSVTGGAGNDYLEGAAGNDLVDGGAGDDEVLGGIGDDSLAGGEGDDDIFGETGNDTIAGDAGDDSILGGEGDDSLSGGEGNDTLLGGVGNDSLTGDAGDDLIIGGDGDDRARLDVSIAGSDSIDLGDGSDVISITGADQVRIALDLSEVANANSGYPVGIQAEDADGNLIGDESFTVGETIKLVAEPGTRFDVRDSVTDEAYGDNFEQVILGAEGEEQFFDFSTPNFESSNRFIAMGGGNDVVYTTAGGDYISGGAGNDFLYVLGGNNTLSGGEGSDVVYSIGETEESDLIQSSLLIGGEGNDVLLAVGGNNTLDGGAGNDSMVAVGSGDDVAIVNLADEGDDLINLGGGHNTVKVEGEGEFRLNLNADLVGDDVNAANNNSGDNNYNVYLGLEDNKGQLPAFTDNFVGGGFGGLDYPITDTRTSDEGMRFVAVDGGHFDVRDRSDSSLNEANELGNTFTVVSLGTTGADVLDESETLGDVYINGGAGNDSLVGGDGNDILIGGKDGEYSIDLGEGKFNILSDNDTFVGGLGDDLIIGNGGADLARVNLTTDGNDTLELGTGATNTNSVFYNYTFDTVSISGDKNVTVTFNAAEVGNGNINKSANELAVTLQAEGSDFVVTADDEAIRFVSEGNETFTINDNTVELGSGFDVISLGSSTNDFIDERSFGNTEDSYINGGAGNDVIYSGAGDDLIFGGADRDVIYAGAGADVVYGGEGSDYILGDAGNDVLYGGNGSDYFTGGAGNDTIYGGDDGDSIDVNLSTDGSDSVDLGSGYDTVRISGSSTTRITLDVAAVGNGDIHSTGDNLAVSVQSQDAPGADILHIDDEGVRFSAQDTFNGTVLVDDAKFDVRDLDGQQVSPGDLFDEVVLGTAGSDFVSDYSSRAISDFYNQMVADANETVFVPSTAPDVFVEGGQGDDFLTTSSGDDYLSGGEGNDVMFGSAGNDTFIAGAGDDYIGVSSRVIASNNGYEAFYNTSNPNNSIYKFTSNLQLNDDESGADVLRVNLETDGNDTVNLGSGYDTVELTTKASTVSMTFNGDSVGSGGANDVVLRAEGTNGEPTGNILTTDDEGMRFVAPEGTLFDLHVNGSALGDDFSVVDLGSLGGDVLDDSSSIGRVYLNGGAGDDSITGGANNDYLVGGEGSDTLIGGAGDDRIFGGGGADLLRVNLDSDGSDVVDLGNGLDTVEVSSSEGQIRVSFNSKGVGYGDLNFVSAQAQDADGTLIGSVLTTDDEGIRFVAQDGHLFDLHVNGTSLGDDFGIIDLGSVGDDLFDESLSDSRVYIKSGRGDDTLIGGSADDILRGGEGNDVLAGGAGNDFINGGEGSGDIARYTEEGRELNAGDVFTFDKDVGTLTFSDSQLGGLEVDTLTGIEKLDFGQFNGSNPVFVTEAQLAVLNAADVGFVANNDVTLVVDGSTLSDSHLTLADLQRLGIDHVQTDGSLVNIELGQPETGSFDPRLGIDFTHVNATTGESEVSTVKIGFTNDQFDHLFDESGPDGFVVDLLQTIPGKDQFALIQGGQIALGENEVSHLFGADAIDPKFTFADSFYFKDASSEGFNPKTDVTYTTVTLNVEGSTISDHHLSLFDLAKLGVDEVHLPTGITDTGFNLNLGLGETFEHFATNYLASNNGDFAGAFQSAAQQTIDLATNSITSLSFQGPAPSHINFTGGDHINNITLFDATSETAAAVINTLTQAGDQNALSFHQFENAFVSTVGANIADQLSVQAPVEFVHVLVADGVTEGTVLADSELSAADLDNLGFDELLLGHRDPSGAVTGYSDLDSLLADLNGFDLDSLTNDAANVEDVDQVSVALVNIDQESFSADSFDLADLVALAELGLDKISIGNSFDDFVANGELDISDLISNHPDNLG